MKIENMVLNSGVLKYPNVGTTFPVDLTMLTPLVESYGNVRTARHACSRSVNKVATDTMDFPTDHTATLHCIYIQMR